MAFNSGGTLGGAPIASEPASAAGKPIVLTGSIATQPLAGGPMAASTIVTQTGNQARVEATEARDTAAFVAWNTNATLAATEAKDTASISAVIVATTSFAITDTPDSASGAAIVFWAYAGLAATDAPDVTNFSIDAMLNLSLDATEATDTATFVAGQKIISLTATEAADVSNVVFTMTGSGSLDVSEGKDTANVILYGQWGELITPEATNWQLVA